MEFHAEFMTLINICGEKVEAVQRGILPEKGCLRGVGYIIVALNRVSRHIVFIPLSCADFTVLRTCSGVLSDGSIHIARYSTGLLSGDTVGYGVKEAQKLCSGFEVLLFAAAFRISGFHGIEKGCGFVDNRRQLYFCQ